MIDDGQNLYRLVLAKLGEVTLKGLNRGRFIECLMRNMRWRLRDLGSFEVLQRSSRILVRPAKPDMPFPVRDIIDRLTRIFGIVSVSPALEIEADAAVLDGAFGDYAARVLENAARTTFKIETKRVNKDFPIHSYDLCCALGEKLLEAFPERLTVNVNNPDITFFVEIRDKIFLYHERFEGAKGLPVGMSGKGMLLLSGGIDSPVAGYLMASRGMTLEAVYFHTFPYTGPQALEKVVQLAGLLSRYAGSMKLHIVDFTEVQLAINRSAPEDMLTIVMRRVMMRVAGRLAADVRAKALITGESLGQVASQTLEALVTTDQVAPCPVFRPLIGHDKNDTIEIARRIGTFETSILPYEDCCTVFVSKHPKIHPSPEEAERAEAELDIGALVEYALQHTETRDIVPDHTVLR